MADATYGPKTYRSEGGDKQVVASGGVLDIESGGALKIAGTDVTAQLANAVAGLAAGAKVAGGEVTLDGTNPTPVTTGLATVVGAIAVIKKATTPGDDPVVLSVDFGGAVDAGLLNIYAWKTNGTDPTLVASTDNATVVSWLAIGT